MKIKLILHLYYIIVIEWKINNFTDYVKYDIILIQLTGFAGF